MHKIQTKKKKFNKKKKNKLNFIYNFKNQNPYGNVDKSGNKARLS